MICAKLIRAWFCVPNEAPELDEAPDVDAALVLDVLPELAW